MGGADMLRLRISSSVGISLVVIVAVIALSGPCPSTAGTMEEPIQVQTNIRVSNEPGTRLTLFQVPTQRRLIIEFVAAELDVPTGQTVFLVITTEAGGQFANFPLAVTKQATILTGQDIRIY
jgi:hypothetical protein